MSSVHAERRSRLAAALAESGCDCFITSLPTHVQWLTGFASSNAALLCTADGTATIATDGRYTEQIKAQAPDVPSIRARACAAALIGTLLGDTTSATPRRIGVEAAHVSVAELAKLTTAVDADAREDVVKPELVHTTGVVEKLREVKNAAELQSLRHAASIAVEALHDLVVADLIVAGKSEREVAAELEYRMRIRGADRPSFDTIVASGPNSARPHHGAEDRKLVDGDLVTIDFGAFAGGYNSDMTRTFIVGGFESGSEFSRKIYNIVLEAQRAGIDAARAGTALVDVDKASRSVIDKAGYGAFFVHSTGHGIGIDVHEAPFAAMPGSGTLEPGMTLTIEPGIYVPDMGGVRIEDTLIITDGEPEIITEFPK